MGRFSRGETVELVTTADLLPVNLYDVAGFGRRLAVERQAAKLFG